MAGFWYVSAGLGILALGVVVTCAERRLGTVPAVLGWIMLGLAVWGVLLMPVSGFWAFFLVAGLAFRYSRWKDEALGSANPEDTRLDGTISPIR